MTDTQVIYVRIPAELAERLREEARTALRSVAGQLAMILRERYEEEGGQQ